MYISLQRSRRRALDFFGSYVKYSCFYMHALNIASLAIKFYFITSFAFCGLFHLLMLDFSLIPFDQRQK
uniref:Uncharacterized protein n=1 Tax=Rhizophora mucronata TaxID=61149 RepID=A0A2P2NAF2_RHIMU